MYCLSRSYSQCVRIDRGVTDAFESCNTGGRLHNRPSPTEREAMNARELAARAIDNAEFARTRAAYDCQPCLFRAELIKAIVASIDSATAELRDENQRLRNALCVHCQSGDKPTNGRHTITRPSECEPNEVLTAYENPPKSKEIG